MNTPHFANLLPDHLPVMDFSGTLAGSPWRRLSSSFLAAEEDGFGDVPQVADLFLTGLTPDNSDDGRLYVEVDESYGDVWVRRRPHDDPYRTTDDDLLVSTSPLTGYWPETVTLTGLGEHASLEGRVTFSAAPPAAFQVFVPLSSVAANVIDDEQYNLSSVELRGVTAGNSDRGRLTWTVIPNGYDSVRVALANPAAGGAEVAAAVIPDTGPFPWRCALEPLNESGITGIAVLENFASGSGRLVVKTAEALHLDPGVDLVVPRLAGTGVRAIGVDDDGRLVVL